MKKQLIILVCLLGVFTTQAQMAMPAHEFKTAVGYGIFGTGDITAVQLSNQYHHNFSKWLFVNAELSVAHGSTGSSMLQQIDNLPVNVEGAGLNTLFGSGISGDEGSLSSEDLEVHPNKTTQIMATLSAGVQWSRNNNTLRLGAGISSAYIDQEFLSSRRPGFFAYAPADSEPEQFAMITPSYTRFTDIGYHVQLGYSYQISSRIALGAQFSRYIYSRGDAFHSAAIQLGIGL